MGSYYLAALLLLLIVSLYFKNYLSLCLWVCLSQLTVEYSEKGFGFLTKRHSHMIPYIPAKPKVPACPQGSPEDL
jgi:hypothetical protein